MPSLTDRLARCYSGAVCDVLRETGRRDCILPNTLRPIDSSLTLAGPAWTAFNSSRISMGWLAPGSRREPVEHSLG